MSALHARISRGTTLSVTTGPEQETTAKVDATKAFSVFVLVLITSLVFGLSHAHAQPLVFVDWSWDSALVHNRIAGFVAEHGFGYEVDYLFADTVPGIQGLRRGDVHVSMETWVDNVQEIWDEVIAEGTVVDLGPNFPNAPQGWYVPTYVIEGDPERGIEPMAPDLRSVHDLAQYWELFRDPENPRRGRFHNGPTGWVVSDHNVTRLRTYGLDRYYDVFYPGSQAALDTSIIRAYERGEPWFGYYWEPTWIMGSLDMTMLEEPPYTDECWAERTGDYGCAFPAVAVRIAVNHQLLKRTPDFVEFLRNYETELFHTNEALAYMELSGGDAHDAARWFLREYEELWTQWLDADVAARVKAAL